MAKSLNNNLKKAKAGKNDEFYTELTDIEKELRHYKDHFKGKTIFCNCDDPRISNFFHYFSYNFEALGLKKLITTCYKNQERDLFTEHKSESAIYLEYNGDKNGDRIPNPEEIGIINLQGDGDFRSPESIELLKQADIVVTNPPFSLFREYVAQLIEYDKKFLMIGNQNNLTYKEIFKLVKENKIWTGVDNGGTKWFKVPDHYEIETETRIKTENGQKYFSMGSVYWFTNLDNRKRHEDIILYKTYYGNETEYPTFDNYNAINVNKVADIPIDFKGVMGVPITFIDKYNPEQFEIISSNDVRINENVPIKEHGLIKDKEGAINGKPTYVRVLIKEQKNMIIELKEITVRELTKGYFDDAENGVIGYDGKLDIRPPYQREFVYGDKERKAVIDTLQKNFPLNVMYWAVREDGNFEVIDGQQRTISICQFLNNDFSVNGLAFHNLQPDKQKQVLDYKLMVYFCTGKTGEKLEWFETINIAGKELSKQELRNAVYSGSWVSDAKRYFSKNSRPKLGDDYMVGEANRQYYLETAIAWISDNQIETYMSKNQHEPNANELWLYFQAVISWVKATFPKYRKEMKGLPWGILYNEFKNQKYDFKKLEEEVTTLMLDEDVENKKGIYSYVLTRKERYLNIRAFSDNQKREAFERQKGVCVKCGVTFELNEMEADHITPWHEGGKTTAENCQMLCRHDNRIKSGK